MCGLYIDDQFWWNGDVMLWMVTLMWDALFDDMYIALVVLVDSVVLVV